MRKCKSVVLALGLVLVLSAAGCTPLGRTRSQSARFYGLTPTTAPEKAGITALRDSRLGIGPVTVPSYLRRPQIVTRATANELKAEEFARWAEPLKDNITRVMGENLSRLTGSEQIFHFPWQRSAGVEYEIILEILCFDGPLEGPVTLSAYWAVWDADGGTILPRRKMTATESFQKTGGYEEMAAAMSRALGSLSREIFDALQRRAGNTSRQGTKK